MGVGVLLAMTMGSQAAEFTADELLQAVDAMTPEQAHAFSTKLEAKLWKPLPEGFFSRLAVEAVDTPAGAATTLRELEGDYVFADVRAGVSWRFNPMMSLHAAAGYRIAEDCDLEEGDRKGGFKIEPGGFSGNIGLGVNF